MKSGDTHTRYPKNASAAEDYPRKTSSLIVAVQTSMDEQGSFLIRELQRSRVDLRHAYLHGGGLPPEADVIYCDYTPDLSRNIPWAIGEATAALVVILPQSEPVSPVALEATTPDAVLARPFTANAIKASLVMALSQFRYEQRLRSKVAKLEENLRAMRTIERAKSIIMTSRNIGGDDAYSFIRSQAMARRTSVSSVAETIVSSFGLLNDLAHE